MQHKPVLVVTTGRAGSSLTAAQLDKMGIHMGDRLIQANRTNIIGHWEDADFMELNQKFLNQGRNGDKEDITEEEFVSRLKKLYKAKSDKPWGIKVPSIAQLLPYYLEMPYRDIVVCTRDREQTISSMMRSYDWTYERGEELYEARTKEIEKHLDPEDYIEIEHGSNPVEKLAEELDLEVTDEAREMYIEDTPEDPSILVCSWTTGDIRAEVASSLLEMSHDGRYELEIAFPTGRPVEKNQNATIEDNFLESDHDYILFIDDDNPPTRNPLDLVELDRDIIACPTPQIQDGRIGFMVMGEEAEEGGYNEHKDRRSLQKTMTVGSGCMLVARRVMEELEAPLKLAMDEDGRVDYSGDFHFCERAREAGFSVWAHYDYLCQHFKTIDLLKVIKTAQAQSNDD